MIQFIEDHRDDHGVEPICRVLPIAPTTFYDHLAKRTDPSRLSDRAKRDEELKPEVERVFEENLKVYGVRKIWHLPLGILLRNTLPGNGCVEKASPLSLGPMALPMANIARGIVARLMKELGIEGVIRGKSLAQPYLTKLCLVRWTA